MAIDVIVRHEINAALQGLQLSSLMNTSPGLFKSPKNWTLTSGMSANSRPGYYTSDEKAEQVEAEVEKGRLDSYMVKPAQKRAIRV